ncbi:MAG: Gfo/Idh/MocA family protein, partial [Pirellula sp.]
MSSEQKPVDSNIEASAEASSIETCAPAQTQIGRRGFVATAAASGLAASFFNRSVHAQGSDIIKVGLVGAGGRGTGAAKDAMTADSGCRLTAVAEVTDDRLQAAKNNLKRTLGEQYAVPDDQAFSGLDAIDKLLQTDINVVLLTTPPGFRPMHMEAAVAAGKHIFCEKPIAVDPVGVRRVMAASEAAKAKGLSLVSGLCWRYDLGVKATMEQIHSG